MSAVPLPRGRGGSRVLSSGALTSLASPSCLTRALGSRPAPSYEKACCQCSGRSDYMLSRCRPGSTDGCPALAASWPDWCPGVCNCNLGGRCHWHCWPGVEPWAQRQPGCGLAPPGPLLCPCKHPCPVCSLPPEAATASPHVPAPAVTDTIWHFLSFSGAVKHSWLCCCLEPQQI